MTTTAIYSVSTQNGYKGEHETLEAAIEAAAMYSGHNGHDVSTVDGCDGESWYIYASDEDAADDDDGSSALAVIRNA